MSTRMPLARFVQRYIFLHKHSAITQQNCTNAVQKSLLREEILQNHERFCIIEDEELDKIPVVRKFRTTTQHGAIEGKTQSHDVACYNPDVIIALGYRVQLPVA